ncbi:MAG: hypothetical protein DI629_16795 [Mesorhizobium amorphae]|nr:MAG: hypothetical protein DI629_16795 [Mesorhizobium amorphae]
MSNRLNDLRLSILEAEKAWFSLFVEPYVDAYQQAFDNFKNKLDEQNEANKRNAEMIVLAASVASGSLFMAIVGSATLTTLARRATLRLVARNNIGGTYRAVRDIATHEASTFALGKFMDEVKSVAKREAQSAVSRTIGSIPNRLSSAPLSISNQMQSALNMNGLCLSQTAQAVEASNGLSATEKDAYFAKLRQAPLLKWPEGRVDKEKLSKKIELSMFMGFLLDADQLVQVPPRTTMGGQYQALADTFGPVGARRQSIETSPNAQNYPQRTHPQLQSAGQVMSGYQYIRIAQPGGRIVNRVNQLHGDVIGGPFFTRTGWFDQSLQHQELQKAETVLNEIGRRTRPNQAHAILV